MNGNNKTSTHSPGFQLNVEYFTDPLCCWSWALEPQWRRLRYEFASILNWRNRMSGLIPGWNNYSDTLLDINRPIQMGAVWKEAAVASGMPVDEKIWAECPPASSFPACFAVKTAELQSAEAGDIYLRRIREAVMLSKEDVSKPAALFKIAQDTAALYPQIFSYDLFRQHFLEKKALAAFQQDLNECRLKGIERFPTLLITKEAGKGVVITGYRPYQEIVKTLLEYFPGLPAPNESYPDKGYFSRYWHNTIPREIEELSPSVTFLFKQNKDHEIHRD